jgi:hypothetical protein
MSLKVCRTKRFPELKSPPQIWRPLTLSGASLETERLLRVHLQGHGGKSLRFETLRDPAAEIAERFDVLE